MPISGTLTKTCIVEGVVETNSCTQQKTHETVELLLELIKRSLESGEDLVISVFRKFGVKKKLER